MAIFVEVPLTSRIHRAYTSTGGHERENHGRRVVRPGVRPEKQPYSACDDVLAPGTRASQANDDSTRGFILDPLVGGTQLGAGPIRSYSWGTRPATECPEPTPATASAATRSPIGRGGLSGGSALSVPAAASLVACQLTYPWSVKRRSTFFAARLPLADAWLYCGSLVA